MSTTSGGPNISTNGLVLHLDAANTKSFRGEPTTNLVVPFPISTSTPTGHNFGYEYDATVVGAPKNDIPFSDKTWIKLVKNSATNGRATFLGIGSLIAGGTYEWSAHIYCDDSRVTTLGMNSDNVANSYNLRNSAYDASRLNVVQRISSSFFSVNGVQTQGIRGGATDAIGSTFYITGLQVENKNYSTPVTFGTRGTTVATGGGWADRTPNSNHGELVNGPTFNAANQGSIVFDGSNDYILVNSNTSILSSTAYTKIAWFYPTSLATNNNIISGTNSAQHAFWLAGGNKLNAGHNGNWSTVVSTSTISINNWYFGAVTFSTTSGWNLYFNGVSESTSVSTTTFTGDGRIQIGAYEPAGNPFTGRIANVLVYNRVLTSTEILQIYNTTKSRFGLS